MLAKWQWLNVSCKYFLFGESFHGDSVHLAFAFQWHGWHGTTKTICTVIQSLCAWCDWLVEPHANKSRSSFQREWSCVLSHGKTLFGQVVPSKPRGYVIWWASSSPVELVMPHPLAQALMKYCSALTVMQQLEAQHHFLHQKVSIGRASLPASTCAFLRRRTNKDLATPGLRDNLDRLLADLSKLVAIKWDSRTDSCAVFVFCCVP